MANPELIFAPAAVRDDSPSFKESGQRWWLLFLLFTGMLLGYAQRGAFSVAAPFISQNLGLSKVTIGVLLSAFFWSYALMQIPAGWVVDRFGVRRAYSIGFILWSLATALTGFGTSLASFIASRVIVGVGQAVSFPATSRAVANWFQERERGTVTAIYLTGVRFGTAIISLIGAYFLAGNHWQLFFMVTGLVPLVWLLPWMKFLGKLESPSSASSSSSTSSDTSFLAGLALLKRRSVLGIFLGFFAYDYAWFVFITWLPGYLVLERQFSPREMGIYSSIPYLAMSVVIIFSGIFSDWLVRRGHNEITVRKIFIVTGLIVCCLIVPAGLVADKMTAVWLLTLALCGLGIASPNTWTLTQAVCEKRIVGTVTGIQNFGGNLGGIIAPALTGFIAHVTNSFALALIVTGVILVTGAIAYWFLINAKVEVGDRLIA
ncbi:MAG: MFS transporter [Pyrinomonadaceae bacterium]